jgi:DtxR family Mn-dependent transcriptional regulator
MFFSPKMGIVTKAIRRARATRRVALEDELKEVFSLQMSDSPVTAAKLAARRQRGLNEATGVLRGLEREGWLTGDALTTVGKRKALEIIRAHRLWERFLVDRVGLSWDKLHAEAERIEHVLTPAMVEELDESLHRPQTDPHGAPIPSREGEVRRAPTRALLDLRPGESGRIIRVKDEDANALRVLAERGIRPQMAVEVVSCHTGDVTVNVNGIQQVLVRDVAEHILVGES